MAGADAEAALTWSFSDLYALRLGITWKRYWYDMHSKTGNTFLVGGAVDQSFLFKLSLVLQAGTTSHGGDAEAAPGGEGKAGQGVRAVEGSGGGSEGGGGDAGKTSGGADE